MANLAFDFRDKKLGFLLVDKTFQRIIATYKAGSTTYVAFAIEEDGFGAFYIERTTPVLPHPSYHEYHTNNLVTIPDEEFNWVAKELLERKILDPRWLPTDVAQNYKE